MRNYLAEAMKTLQIPIKRTIETIETSASVGFDGFDGFDGSSHKDIEKFQPDPERCEENIEMHDSMVVVESNARQLIEQLQAAGCRFMVVDAVPRLYYSSDLAAELVQRVASLVRGRDENSRMFRRLARASATKAA